MNRNLNRISEHLATQEICCRCGCGLGRNTHDIDPCVVAYFEIIRSVIKTPLIITSGLRCPDWNKKVGGVPDSIHCAGGALDIKYPTANDKISFLSLCDEVVGMGGVGQYETFVHIDCGDLYGLPKYRRWDEREKREE